MSKFYITTPIYYVNAKPHLGGAYTTVAADVLTRFYRMRGNEVFFLTGTDEHGAKIVKAAEEQNKSPKEWCDENASKYQLVWDELQISYDNFIRTTYPNHEKAVAKAVQRLYDKGLIYRGTYRGLYCMDCERYYTAKELVGGKCPDHQKEPVILTEDCYFFKLSIFQKPLLKLIDEKDWLIEPIERKNEVLGFLKSEKLEDLAISRSRVEWGVLVPWDGSHTIYVWIDALLNYLTGVGWEGDGLSSLKFWPPEIQIIGKDILRFHAVVWPALLLALEIPLPKKIFAHGLFTNNGRKMSKTLGNIIDPVEQVKIFSSDGLRWLLLSSFPFGIDGDFSQEKFYEKYNADLANSLGNFVARILTLAIKIKNKKLKMKNDKENFEKEIKKVWRRYEGAMENLAFEEAVKEILNFVAFCDRFINETEPWKLAKTNFVKFQKVIYNLLEGLRQIAWLIYPFMPNTSDKIFEQLGILSSEKKKELEKAKKWGGVKFEKIKKGEVLFPRL